MFMNSFLLFLRLGTTGPEVVSYTSYEGTFDIFCGLSRCVFPTERISFESSKPISKSNAIKSEPCLALPSFSYERNGALTIPQKLPS